MFIYDVETSFGKIEVYLLRFWFYKKLKNGLTVIELIRN